MARAEVLPISGVPTCVGVNRDPDRVRPEAHRCPHVRGGEPMFRKATKAS